MVDAHSDTIQWKHWCGLFSASNLKIKDKIRNFAKKIFLIFWRFPLDKLHLEMLQLKILS